MANYRVQSVGNFTATFRHPLILSNAAISLKGFKLEDTFVTSAQQMDNSKLVPLVDGGTVTLTNSMRAGRVTINALRVTNSITDPTTGDLPLIAMTLQGLSDNVGGTLVFSYPVTLNGTDVTQTITFHYVTVVTVPPLIMAGNDIIVYPVVLNYAYYDVA